MRTNAELVSIQALSPADCAAATVCATATLPQAPSNTTSVSAPSSAQIRSNRLINRSPSIEAREKSTFRNSAFTSLFCLLYTRRSRIPNPIPCPRPAYLSVRTRFALAPCRKGGSLEVVDQVSRQRELAFLGRGAVHPIHRR